MRLITKQYPTAQCRALAAKATENTAAFNDYAGGGDENLLNKLRQTFEFDRYGNRNFDEANTTFTGFDKLCESGSALCEELRKVLNPDVNQSDNRLSSSDGYVFDDAGNTTRDPQLRKFTYDAENKQVKVESVDSGGTVTGTIGEYVYDGDAKRIKKIVPMAIAPFNDEVTVFVYDAAGKLVAEYATEISQDPKVSYTTADHLGSPRILTDENGATISRRDFHPFGEEILTTHRHPDLGYTPDDVRQKFTTYERDGETDLDFAQARYFSSTLGRFVSTDPVYIGPTRITDPQYLNLYHYSRNNPLRFIDPDGEEVLQLGNEAVKALKAKIREAERQLKADKKNSTLASNLATLKNSLAETERGNKVVGAWLKVLNERGEGKGMTLKDFKISTTPGTDMVAEARMANETGDYNYELELMGMSANLPDTAAMVIAEQIYVFSDRAPFTTSEAVLGGQQMMFGTALIDRSDVLVTSATILEHEREHRDNRANEYQAYSAQVKVFERMNKVRPLKNQDYFRAIKGQLEQKRDYEKPKN